MKKIIITVIGDDRPGILSTVSQVIFESNCNIENISQTILQTEFAGIFVVTIPHESDMMTLHHALDAALSPMGLHVHTKAVGDTPEPEKPVNSSPFMITTMGPDKKGLVADITNVIADFGINIMQLKAVFKGGMNPNDNIMIYEVDIPDDIDRSTFTQTLRTHAKSLNLEVNLQHKYIFEAINKI